jgi:hypothetical protein
VVWDRIEEKIRQGHTYHTAIDSLYEQYGQDLSLTAIINKNEEGTKTLGLYFSFSNGLSILVWFVHISLSKSFVIGTL